MRSKALVAALGAAAAAGAAIALAAMTRPWESPSDPARADLSSQYPGGHPIDASRISTGRLTFQVMPPEVTGALELHSDEIVRTAEQLASKQARVTGTCAPGSAIRLVAEDGSVVCQRFPKGVVSVPAAAGVPRVSTTGTAQGTVPGGVGRYQTSGEDDFLIVPVQLPHGAVVTGFSYTYWDADPRVDGAAYLYRSDDAVLAAIGTQGASAELRFAETDQVKERKVDDVGYAYFVYFQVSAQARENLMPVSASIVWRLP